MSIDLKFNMSLIGQQTVKKSILEVKKEMDSLSKFGQKGGMSPTEIKKAEDAFKSLMKVTKEAEKGEKQYLFALEKTREKLKGLSKDTLQYAKNREKMDELRKKYSEFRGNVAQPLGAAKRSAANVRDRMAASQGGGDEEEKFGSSYVKGGIIAAAGRLVGKILIDSMKMNYDIQTSQYRGVGNLRGNPESSLLEASGAGYRVGHQQNYAWMENYGIKPADYAKAQIKYGNIGGKSYGGNEIGTYLGLERSGIDEGTLLSMRRSAIKSGAMDQTGEGARRVLSDAVRSGLEDARRGEFIEGVTAINTTLQQQGINASYGQSSDFLRRIGENSNNPMLKGEFGAAFASNALSATQNPTDTGKKVLEYQAIVEAHPELTNAYDIAKFVQENANEATMINMKYRVKTLGVKAAAMMGANTMFGRGDVGGTLKQHEDAPWSSVGATDVPGTNIYQSPEAIFKGLQAKAGKAAALTSIGDWLSGNIAGAKNNIGGDINGTAAELVMALKDLTKEVKTVEPFQPIDPRTRLNGTPGKGVKK